MIQEALQARKLPDLLTMNDGSPVTKENWRARRAELLDMLYHEEYGYTPEAPKAVRATVVERNDKAFAHKAFQETIQLEFDTPNGPFSFPFYLIVPYGVKKPPVFLNINFRPDIPDKYLPAEEILDNGYAIADLFYEEVTCDHWTVRPPDLFADGLAALYPREGDTAWGKLGMWAFAASRVMDYLCTRTEIDEKRVAVVGHSRLGKTALWCAAQDERFSMAISNDSGCGGAAIFRDKVGETIRYMAKDLDYWFCDRYKNYVDREHDLPFDQHALIAMIAPRPAYIASAAEDEWADPRSEFLATAAASPVWEMLGVPGLQTPDAFPGDDTVLAEGLLAYHVRPGSHFFSRTDWVRYMNFRKAHENKF